MIHGHICRVGQSCCCCCRSRIRGYYRRGNGPGRGENQMDRSRRRVGNLLRHRGNGTRFDSATRRTTNCHHDVANLDIARLCGITTRNQFIYVHALRQFITLFQVYPKPSPSQEYHVLIRWQLIRQLVPMFLRAFRLTNACRLGCWWCVRFHCCGHFRHGAVTVVGIVVVATVIIPSPKHHGCCSSGGGGIDH